MKTLLVRNNGFGDIIWTEPIVRYFLSQNEEVLVIAGHDSIFHNYPNNRLYVNDMAKIFPFTEPPIDLQFQEHPKMHYLECFRLQAGLPDLPLTYPQLHLTSEEKKRKIEKAYAILHLDSYAEVQNFRNVYGVDWKQVIDFLRQKGFEVIQISKRGKDLVAPWHATSDFREIMSLIYNSSLFIGLDSGPSHIAAAMNIPSIIFFGSVNPKYRHLNNEKKVFLQSPCPFAHCYHETPFTLGQTCRLVGSKGQPPCCIQDTSKVMHAIESLT